VLALWLQGGRIDLGFLGAAQIDRFANINTTVIGDYAKPKIRLPGAGGAPEIATSCGEVLITLRQNKRAFVEKLDFVTSIGHVTGGDSRRRMNLPGKGPTAVITDLGILTPDPETRELTLTSVNPGIAVEQDIEATGWPLKVAPELDIAAPPSDLELEVLRVFEERTAAYDARIAADQQQEAGGGCRTMQSPPPWDYDASGKRALSCTFEPDARTARPGSGVSVMGLPAGRFTTTVRLGTALTWSRHDQRGRARSRAARRG
jgi:hypothetical protein